MSSSSLGSEELFSNTRNMSRAGRRRFNGKIRDLTETFDMNPALFHRRWNNLVQGWMREVHRRANAWAIPTEELQHYSKEQLVEIGKIEVFEVVEIARSVIESCGTGISKTIGATTIDELTNECVKAVAAVVDQRLDYQVDKRMYGRIKR